MSETKKRKDTEMTEEERQYELGQQVALNCSCSFDLYVMYYGVDVNTLHPAFIRGYKDAGNSPVFSVNGMDGPPLGSD